MEDLKVALGLVKAYEAESGEREGEGGCSDWDGGEASCDSAREGTMG